jgi:hypothetical protein
MAYFPIDAQSAHTTIAVAQQVSLIATSTTPITVLNIHLDKAAQSSQLVQCKNNNGTFYSLTQAVGTTEQNEDMSYVMPANTGCYLKTFDNTLTHASITWVPYNIASSSIPGIPTSTSTSTTTPYTGVTYANWLLVVAVFLFFISLMAWKIVFMPIKQIIK